MKTKASRPWWRGKRSQRRRRKVADPSLVTEQGALELPQSVDASSARPSIHWPFAPLLNSPWFWPFFISGATAFGAAVWIFSLPPVSDCRQTSPLTTDAERLYCADLAARRGNVNALTAALELVSQWPKDHPLYAQALELSNEWSQATIVIARRQFEQGNVDYAKSIIQKVPKTSTHYAQAQSLLTVWTTDDGTSLAAQAISAINGADWPAALDIARRLSLLGSDHWSHEASKLIIRINRERDAWGQLEEARSLAGWQTANELVAAIVLAQKINPDTIAGERVPEEIQPWIAEVIQYAQEWQAAGNIQDAIGLMRDIAPVLGTTSANLALLQLGQAEAAAQQDSFWGYWEALVRLEQLPADPTLTAYVTTKQQAWEKQAQNLGQLQLARVFAGLAQTWGYQLAILQAQSVTLGQPRRIEAQTFIAQWQKQIQASQAQPLLNAAQELAKAEKYTQAKIIVQRIPSTNPLFATAQAEIRQWQAQLDTQRDQPILTQAQALAENQKLQEAIATASQIPASSPLYRQAQENIQAWYQEQWRIEDAQRERQRPLWSAPRPEPSPETPAYRPEPNPEYRAPETPSSYPYPSPTTPAAQPPPPTVSPEPAPVSPEPPNVEPAPSSPAPVEPPPPPTIQEAPPPEPASPSPEN